MRGVRVSAEVVKRVAVGDWVGDPDVTLGWGGGELRGWGGYADVATWLNHVDQPDVRLSFAQVNGGSGCLRVGVDGSASVVLNHYHRNQFSHPPSAQEQRVFGPDQARGALLGRAETGSRGP